MRRNGDFGKECHHPSLPLAIRNYNSTWCLLSFNVNTTVVSRDRCSFSGTRAVAHLPSLILMVSKFVSSLFEPRQRQYNNFVNRLQLRVSALSITSRIVLRLCRTYHFWGGNQQFRRQILGILRPSGSVRCCQKRSTFFRRFSLCRFSL